MSVGAQPSVNLFEVQMGGAVIPQNLNNTAHTSCCLIQPTFQQTNWLIRVSFIFSANVYFSSPNLSWFLTVEPTENLARWGRQLSADESPFPPLLLPLSPLQFSMTTSWLTLTWSLRTSSLSTQTTPSCTTLRRCGTTAGTWTVSWMTSRILNKQEWMHTGQHWRLPCG